MKKIITTVLALSLLLGTTAFAEPSPSPSAEPETEVTETEEVLAETPSPSPDIQAEQPVTADKEDAADVSAAVPAIELSTEFKLDLTVQKHKYIISNNAVIELYDEEGNLLGTQLRYVGWDTPSVTMRFEVPEYRMGKRFKIKLAEGLRAIWYYDEMAQTGEMIDIQTFGYLDEDGDYVQNNGASITADPYFEKDVHLYITNRWYNDLEPRARVIDGVVMAPVRTVAEAMGLSVTYNPEWDSVTCALEDKKCIFWAYNEYVALPSGETNAPHVPVYVDGSLFVPVKTLAEAFECSLEDTDYGEFIDILIGEAPYHQVIRNRIPVNKNGIGSRTNYLVWVSKHEYKVRVYEGQQYHWKQLKEFPCALGAWNTPTVTGQFEYIERTRWDYGSYYVGPVLRFYNGYALHSTLLNYGGGEYDGRVGVNISHGCVRLHPQDINWIAATIPLRTRIYITE